MSDVYREAAALLVFHPLAKRGQPASLKFLVLHKPRKRDAWQLPQGGIEAGETAVEAALRELNEEAGISDVLFLGESQEHYQYDFPASFRRFRPDHVRGQSITFVLVQANNPEIRVDGVEIDRAQWMTLKELPRFIKRPAYLALVRRLHDEGEALLAAS